MGRVTKFSAEQIQLIAQTVVDMGPGAAVKELEKVGIKISAGGAYFWAKKIYPEKFKPREKKEG